MNVTEREMYSSVEEMMNDLDEIINKFPEQMKEEINTRIISSTKSTKYKCEFSDLIINCCIGNEMSENIISLFIKKFNFYGTNDKSKQQLHHILDFKNNNKIVTDYLNKQAYKFDDENNDDKLIKHSFAQKNII